MSVSGLCQICESASAEQQCGQCGMLVCHTHYDEETNLCADCATQVRGTDRQGDTFQF